MHPLNFSLTHPQLPLAHPISSVFGEKILSEGVTESLSSFGVTFSLSYHKSDFFLDNPNYVFIISGEL